MAATDNNYLVVAEVAAELGVTAQRVRHLLAHGELTGQRVGSMWLVEPESLERYRRVRQPRAGRALSPSSAWAALLTCFGTDMPLELVGAFRLFDERRARLRALRARPVDDWRWLARRRADAQHYATRQAYIARIAQEPGVIGGGLSHGMTGPAERETERGMRSGMSPGALPGMRPGFVTGPGIADGATTVDVYADTSTAERLVNQYRLRPDPAGNVTVRTINAANAAQLTAIRSRPLPSLVIAVDLLEDRDPRTSTAGRDLLTAILDDIGAGDR